VNAATVAHQQGLSQFNFEQADLPAKRRLRDGQKSRRTCDAANLSDTDEIL
jgi:hypothetical protein